jgi:hypothetical protein
MLRPLLFTFVILATVAVLRSSVDGEPTSGDEALSSPNPRAASGSNRPPSLQLPPLRRALGNSLEFHIAQRPASSGGRSFATSDDSADDLAVRAQGGNAPVDAPMDDDIDTPVDEPPAARPAEAVELLHCDFNADWDKNFDNWPDRWTRERSVAYPHYLPIKMVDDHSPVGERALRIELNGGAAAVHSPTAKVDSMYTYVVEGYARTENLKRDEAHISITFLDAKDQPLQTVISTPLRRTTRWTKLRVGPVSVPSAKAQRATITLHVGPRDDKADLTGAALFTDVWLGRLPRMTLVADRHSHLYYVGEVPEITCTASGFPLDQPPVIFELLDLERKVVDRTEVKLTILSSEPTVGLFEERQPAEPAPSETPAPETSDAAPDLPDHAPQEVFAGSAVWKPTFREPGFYCVRVEMPGKTGVANYREVSLAVVDKISPAAEGEFGWSLPDGDKPLTLVELAEVLGQSGCNWCKFPLWNESYSNEREEQLVWFAERLGLRKIEMIGLLIAPPSKDIADTSEGQIPQAAGVFSMPSETWYPSLEPIMTRLSLKVRWWQLGTDQDQSWVGYPQLARKIASLKKQLTRYGQRIHLGMGWSWLKEPPREKPTWDFLVFSASPPLTWEEQLAYTRATQLKDCARWLVLEPLDKESYSTEVRATDLVMRMLAAKMERVEAVFIPQAFDDRTGLMNSDGTVGELFVPWRTAAHHLAGAEALGSLNLPGSCNNQIFSRGDELVMALWSDQPTKLRLYVGSEARQIDLWGREKPLVEQAGQQIIEVSQSPLFIKHVDPAIVRTQMSVAFDSAQLASQFGKPQSNGLSFKNHFQQSIRGTVRMMTPESWRVSPKDIPFKLAAGETSFQQCEVTLQTNAATGKQLVRLDFDLTADRRYRFSVYRYMEVGLGDIFAEALTRMNERGDLEVEQRITNETDETVSFKCYLYAPGRKRMMTHVEDHGRGVDTKIFRLGNADELIGKPLFLRAEEINGTRILNYSVMAQP